MSASHSYSAMYDTRVDLDYRRGDRHSPDVTLVARALDVEPAVGQSPPVEEADDRRRQQMTTRVLARNLVQPIVSRPGLW